MMKLFLARLLYVIPTLLLITLLTFIISLHTPGDPVTLRLHADYRISSKGDIEYWQKYRAERERLHQRLPVFYFGFSRLALPDTFYKIDIPEHRALLNRLIWKYGNWPEIQAFYNQLLHDLGNPNLNLNTNERNDLYRLLEEYTDQYKERIQALNPQKFSDLFERWNRVKAEASPWKNYLPAWRWYGLRNQYHHWLFGYDKHHRGVIAGDLGRSFRSNQPVTQILFSSIGVTLQLSIMALLLVFFCSIPLGLRLAMRAGSWADRWVNAFLYALYSIPAFWMGTLLIVFFSGGDFFDFFPPFGLGDTAGLTVIQGFGVRLRHLVLPVFCLFYPLFAYLTRQMRNATLHEIEKPYALALKARGLSSRQLKKHFLVNASLPQITIIGQLIPWAISGSLVVEVVFSIPGMGKTSLDALYARDFPVVIGAVLISAFFTIAGFLLSDFMYRLADPRIHYKRQEETV